MAILLLPLATPVAAAETDVSHCDLVSALCQVQVNCDGQLQEVCDVINESIDLSCHGGDAWSCIEAVFVGINNVHETVFSRLDSDQDWDHYPDDVESELCGRQAFRDIILQVPNGGSCTTDTDYQAAVNSITAFVPESATMVGDFDWDDVPRWAVITGHQVVIDTEGNRLIYSYDRVIYQDVDPDDANRNVPVPYDDIDNVEQEVLDEANALIDEAEATIAATIDLAEWLGSLLVALAEQAAADGVALADATGAYLWNEAMGTWQPIWDMAEQTAEDVIDWLGRTIGEAEQFIEDTYDMADADDDRVADALEPTICYVENRNSGLDGTCEGGDYTPPALPATTAS